MLIIMGGRGRPKKGKDERRDRQFHILLTEPEQRIIEEAAKAESSEMSPWARNVLLNAARSRQKKK
jgi:hypothetical protein